MEQRLSQDANFEAVPLEELRYRIPPIMPRDGEVLTDEGLFRSRQPSVVSRERQVPSLEGENSSILVFDGISPIELE